MRLPFDSRHQNLLRSAASYPPLQKSQERGTHFCSPYRQSQKGRPPGIDDSSTVALYRMELGTRQSQRIPGTDGLYNPLWSPDGRWLAASDAKSERLLLVDLKSGKRTQLTRPAQFPVWSADSQYIYYPAHYSTDEHAIFRVHVPDGAEERFLDVNFRAASASFGLAPDGSLVISREHGHYDVYALSLATPSEE